MHRRLSASFVAAMLSMTGVAQSAVGAPSEEGVTAATTHGIARAATLKSSVVEIEEGDRYKLIGTVRSPARAKRVTFEKYAGTDIFGDPLWEAVASRKVGGERTVTVGVVALGPNFDRYRVAVTYRHGRRAVSRPVSVKVWRWIPLSEYAAYYTTGGVGLGTVAINGIAYDGWGPYSFSNAGSWEARFTPGRHCKAFRGVVGVADISTDGSSGSMTFIADDAVVYESPALTPGMDVDVEVVLSRPYRFGIRLLDTSPDVDQSWPVIGDPAFLCAGV